jgi:hypothetical protein
MVHWLQKGQVMRRTAALAALGVLLAVTLAACAGERVEQPPPAARSNQQVQAITENLSVTGPFLAVTRVEPEPGKEDPAHLRYLVHAQFQYLNVEALVLTLSHDGRVEGLELYPRTEW